MAVPVIFPAPFAATALSRLSARAGAAIRQELSIITEVVFNKFIMFLR
jgi:hypothetical protein